MCCDPGDRLPSVRQARASRGVSPSTVFQAYYLLEAQGLIRARERSGYYVADGARQLPPEPEAASQPEDDAVPLDVSEHVFEILESTMVRDVVPLGSAFPSPLLFPLPRLGQLMASSVQNLDPWSTVDDLTPGNARAAPADRAALPGRRHRRSTPTRSSSPTARWRR